VVHWARACAARRATGLATTPPPPRVAAAAALGRTARRWPDRVRYTPPPMRRLPRWPGNVLRLPPVPGPALRRTALPVRPARHLFIFPRARRAALSASCAADAAPGRHLAPPSSRWGRSRHRPDLFAPGSSPSPPLADRLPPFRFATVKRVIEADLGAHRRALPTQIPSRSPPPRSPGPPRPPARRPRGRGQGAAPTSAVRSSATPASPFTAKVLALHPRQAVQSVGHSSTSSRPSTTDRSAHRGRQLRPLRQLRRLTDRWSLVISSHCAGRS
jgi:hypothetical protein